MLCYVLPYYTISHYIIPYYTIRYDVLLYYVMLYYVLQWVPIKGTLRVSDSVMIPVKLLYDPRASKRVLWGSKAEFSSVLSS